MSLVQQQALEQQEPDEHGWHPVPCRFTSNNKWNVHEGTSPWHSLPLGLLVSPCSSFSHISPCSRRPLVCLSCGAALNPFCPVEQDGCWSCCFCGGKNPNMFQELQAGSTTDLAQVKSNYAELNRKDAVFAVDVHPTAPGLGMGVHSEGTLMNSVSCTIYRL
jgi:ferredoxin